MSYFLMKRAYLFIVEPNLLYIGIQKSALNGAYIIIILVVVVVVVVNVVNVVVVVVVVVVNVVIDVVVVVIIIISRKQYTNISIFL